MTTQIDKAIIVSRAIYNAMGDERGLGILSEYRLTLMQRYFINSLRNQTDSDFTIYLIVGPENSETVNKIESLDWSNLNVNFMYSEESLADWKFSVEGSRNFGREADIGCPEDVVRKSDHPKTSIMARLDTDDWVAPGWIAHMKHMAATKPESHFLINYQVVGQGPDGRLYHFFNSYNQARTSPFIVLVQKESPRISPYEDTHLKMGQKFATVYNIPPSYVFMVIHRGNRRNRVYQLDRYFEDVEPWMERTKTVPVRQEKTIGKSAQGSDWRSRMLSNQDCFLNKQTIGAKL